MSLDKSELHQVTASQVEGILNLMAHGCGFVGEKKRGDRQVGRPHGDQLLLHNRCLQSAGCSRQWSVNCACVAGKRKINR